MSSWEIEADWNLDLYCNFHCQYCISRSNHTPLAREGNLEFIKRFFDSTGLKWHLHFTGGEPFLFPDFLEFIKYFTANHFVSINTNLSGKLVEKLIGITDPEKIVFINAGLHIEEREKLDLTQDFISKVSLFQSKGFRIFVSYVMAPHLFRRFESDFRFFESEGVIIFPKILRGYYKGKLYPESYSQSEREQFKSYFKLAAQARHRISLSYTYDERLLIDIDLDKEFVDGIQTFHGKPCLSGSKFVRIWPDGTITRCDKKGDSIGNVYSNELHLTSNAEPCNTFSCPYFCVKYTEMARR